MNDGARNRGCCGDAPEGPHQPRVSTDDQERVPLVEGEDERQQGNSTALATHPLGIRLTRPCRKNLPPRTPSTLSPSDLLPFPPLVRIPPGDRLIGLTD